MLRRFAFLCGQGNAIPLRGDLAADLHGAVEALPTLSLTGTAPNAPEVMRAEVMRATGTDPSLTLLLTLAGGKTGQTGSSVVHLSRSSVRDDHAERFVVTSSLANENGSKEANSSEPSEVGVTGHQLNYLFEKSAT